jgi:uncharacterized protein YdhG (YjbR/CyaY superfamily)
MEKPDTIDAYLNALAPDRRTVIEAMGEVIRSAAPDAVQSIAYDMPAFRTTDGRFLVSYAAFKQHYSVFPASDGIVETLGDEIRPYLAGSGTIRFRASRPVPLALIRRIVQIRVEELAKKR